MTKNSEDIILPFILGGSSYSDRDRLMFGAGFDLALIYEGLRVMKPKQGTVIRQRVLMENEDRIRVLLSRHKRKGTITRIDDTYGILEFV